METEEPSDLWEDLEREGEVGMGDFGLQEKKGQKILGLAHPHTYVSQIFYAPLARCRSRSCPSGILDPPGPPEVLGQHADDGRVGQHHEQSDPVGGEVQVLANHHHEQVVGLAQPGWRATRVVNVATTTTTTSTTPSSTTATAKTARRRMTCR